MREAHAAVQAVSGARVLVAELALEHRVVADATGAPIRVQFTPKISAQDKLTLTPSNYRVTHQGGSQLPVDIKTKVAFWYT